MTDRYIVFMSNLTIRAKIHTSDMLECVKVSFLPTTGVSR